MTDLATSLRLLLGLIVVVYCLLVVVSEPRPTRRILLAAVGIVPFVVWLAAPETLSVGAIDITLRIRRASLVAGAAAVGLRYATVRAAERTVQTRRIFAAASAVLLVGMLVAGTANWLVAAAALVTAVGTGILIPSEASSDADRQPPPGRPDA